jgi:hypothetical protein
MSRLTDIQDYIEKKPHMLKDVAYTLGVRRDHLSHRGYLISDGKGSISGIQSSVPVITADRLLIFAFTGQGAQWAGMGRELLSNFGTFHRDIHAMDHILQGIESPIAWSIEGGFFTPFRSLCTSAKFQSTNNLLFSGATKVGGIQLR